MTAEAFLCFDPKLRERFKNPGNETLIDDLEAAYAKMVALRRDHIQFSSLENITERHRAFNNCEVLQQVLLHRSERLMAASGSMVLQENIYGMTLVVRGHFETTAVLGYLCNRIASYLEGKIGFDVVIMDIAKVLMGGRHALFKEEIPDPVNILTCLEKADRFFERLTKSEKRGMLSDCHAWLSEFSHPNFNSNSSAFNLHKPDNRFEFRHGDQLAEAELEQFGYLDISAGIFLMFYEEFKSLSLKAFS